MKTIFTFFCVLFFLFIPTAWAGSGIYAFDLSTWSGAKADTRKEIKVFIHEVTTDDMLASKTFGGDFLQTPGHVPDHFVVPTGSSGSGNYGYFTVYSPDDGLWWDCSSTAVPTWGAYDSTNSKCDAGGTYVTEATP